MLSAITMMPYSEMNNFYIPLIRFLFSILLKEYTERSFFYGSNGYINLKHLFSYCGCCLLARKV